MERFTQLSLQIKILTYVLLLMLRVCILSVNIYYTTVFVKKRLLLIKNIPLIKLSVVIASEWVMTDCEILSDAIVITGFTEPVNLTDLKLWNETRK